MWRFGGLLVAVGVLGLACAAEETPTPAPVPEVSPAPSPGGGGGGAGKRGKRGKAGKTPGGGGGGGAPAGGWSADIPGVCQMLEDCGCPEHPSTRECVTAFNGMASAFSPSVCACIVGLDCQRVCTGDGARCIEAGAPSGGGGGGAGHDTKDCWPTGITCPAGTTEVLNWCGVVVDCR